MSFKCHLSGRHHIYVKKFASIGRMLEIASSWLVGATAVQLVFNPFSQFVPQLELYSQLQLSLWSDPIAFFVFLNQQSEC